jgi:hypothetical protein
MSCQEACLCYSSKGIDNIFKVKSNGTIIIHLAKHFKIKLQKSSPTFCKYKDLGKLLNGYKSSMSLFILAYIRKRSVEDKEQDSLAFERA